MTVSIRRARPDDIDFLVELLTHEEVDPYLAARRSTTREQILEEIERSANEPYEFGRFVIEVDDERAGVMGFSVANKRSRVAFLGGLAVHPDFRGRHVSDEAARLLQRHLVYELGFHRLQLEIYGFNERAIRHAERSGFVKEGVRRNAYRRHGRWVDGIIYGLVLEDLEPPPLALLHDHVARFNEGVRTGDWESMLELFADDAELAFEGVPVGPFAGREAIAAAYRAQPPDDELRVLDASEQDGRIVTPYAWMRVPDARAGEMRLDHEDGRITRLVVTFDKEA